MKKAVATFAVVLALGMTMALDAEAKRLGGGKSAGMQRQNVTTPHNAPGAPGSPAQAAPTAAPAAAGATAAAAAAPKRSWMGPIAGLAAGLGLAALASHLGFGEALANMMMIGLLVMAVLMVVGFVMRKRAAGNGPSLAGAGAPLRQGGSQFGSRIGSAIGGGLGATPAATTQAAAIPAGFDKAGFERNAKAQFLALQAANDARDLNQLRGFLTPDMFELVRADLEERGDAQQSTEVFGLEAQVLEVTEDAASYIASVRFTGSVRDQHGAVPEDLDEMWHLTKPRMGAGGWVIAGIQQYGEGQK
jgi:predicted lipid-binding transport protein (Tim44 family)